MDSCILGIDPGLRRTGFGVLRTRNRQLIYQGCGTIQPAGQTLPERLRSLARDLQAVIAEYQPDQVAIEIVFVNVNPQSTLLLGQARGAAITVASLAGLPVAEYTALQIKKAVVGHGKAAKQQVQEMVKNLLQLPTKPGLDAADALGAAICHAHHQTWGAVLQGSGLQSKIEKALGGDLQKALKIRGGRLVFK